jgi:hypothetical protein
MIAGFLVSLQSERVPHNQGVKNLTVDVFVVSWPLQGHPHAAGNSLNAFQNLTPLKTSSIDFSQGELTQFVSVKGCKTSINYHISQDMRACFSGAKVRL